MPPHRSDLAAASHELQTVRQRLIGQLERSGRIAGMLERWNAEDVSGEPEWDVDTLEPLKLRSEKSST